MGMQSEEEEAGKATGRIDKKTGVAEARGHERRNRREFKMDVRGGGRSLGKRSVKGFGKVWGNVRGVWRKVRG